MPVFETCLKIINFCFLYIQEFVTRNKFTQFKSSKLETLTFLESNKMFILGTIISSLVNKYYYYILLYYYIILLFSLLPRVVLYFSCNVEVSLGFKLNRIQIKFPKIFQSILCRMDKWNLFLSTNVLLFDTPTILIHHFVLLFSILSKKEKFYVKRKRNTQSSCMTFFFVFYVGWTYISRVS